MIVTSFSQKGYHLYGKRFIESFLKYWKDENLIVYYENGIPSNCPKDDRIMYVNLYSYDEFVAFENLLKRSDPLFTGLMRGMGNEGKPVNTNNFRFNAYCFFRKVFAMTDAMNFEWAKEGPVAWIDADVIIYNDIPEGFISQTLDGKYLAYLGRAGLFSETGYIAFDSNHPVHDGFIDLFRKTYLTGAFRFLGNWTDCYVFDFVREVLQVPEKNLAKGLSIEHPFVDSILGKYMDHLKGPERKDLGYSPELKKREEIKEAV